ncbi:EST2-like protein [Mya arenaria]|uniref:EST2-like protein n=1 Tax=Mya arenaria TaxID=6604 RepID=A0ABY7EZW1_MYAAR|nr:EST2-like protein [Mya arenaria]
MIGVELISVEISQFVFTDAGYSAFEQSDLGGITGARMNVIANGTTKTVHVCLGVSYAKPRVCDLRFKNITETNSGVRVSIFSVVSIPVFTIESEDCLYLNIYKPKNRSGLAVMIHGGGLTSGSADKFNIKILASAFGNAVVVTFNYRVGIFGFLSNMDEHAMGNNGLWDRR